MQLISKEETVRIDTVQAFRVFNSQTLATQAKKGEQLVSMMPAINKAFDLLGAAIVQLSTENEVSKNEIGSYDGKMFEDVKTKTLKQMDDEKKNIKNRRKLY